MVCSKIVILPICIVTGKCNYFMQHDSKLLRVLPSQFENNLPEFSLSYTGFEKTLEQEMNLIVKHNRKIFEKFLDLPNFYSARNNSAKINIQVVYLNGDNN